MLSQRTFLGFGLAVLFAISAASIGLDVKARSDAAQVDQTLAVLKKFTELRLLLRRAESAARGFALASDAKFLGEFREVQGKIAPAFAELIEATRDHPGQTQLLQATEILAVRRLAVSGELLRLQGAGDAAGITALTARQEGRSMMDAVSASLKSPNST